MSSNNRRGLVPLECSFALSAVFCSILWITTCSPIFGQSPLRWQLKPGDALTVRIDQQTTSKVAFGGKSADTKIDLGLELLWTVDSAAHGQFKVKQFVRRITFSLQPQSGPAVKYDSDDKGRPASQARQVAEAVKPLIGAAVLLTMSDRGQILETTPANAAAEKLFATGGDASSVFSRQSVETLLRQPLVVLPEKPVAADEKWSDEPRQITSAAGTFRQATEYRFVGQVEEDGQKLTKIEMTATLAPATAGVAELTLKSHEQSGSILFSTQQGRLVRAEQTQKLATERPYRETMIAVALESKQTTTIAPVAGEQGESAP